MPVKKKKNSQPNAQLMPVTIPNINFSNLREIEKYTPVILQKTKLPTRLSERTSG
jgi:hypothetical protein